MRDILEILKDVGVVSGAALVLGVILAFTGVNIPLGLGLIAVGAAGLATSLSANWGTMDQKTRDVVGSSAFGLAFLALVLGVILAFSGANIPLGIGLIILGVAGTVAAASLAWDSMSQRTKETITGIMGIGGAFFLLLGLILILTGAGIPLGIGLILLGAGMLYGAYKLTPGDDFVEKVKNLWKNVKSTTKDFINWFTDNVLDGIFGEQFGDSLDSLYDNIVLFVDDVTALFNGMAEGDDANVGKALLNSLVDLLNIVIDAINLVGNVLHWLGTQLLALPAALVGKGSDVWNYFRGNGYTLNIPHIPRLSTGMILPGGSPMLAWVNDQPKGQPYLEGSVENIAAAFDKYLGSRSFGNQNVNLIAKGPLAPLIRLLALEIQNENERVSVF